MTKYSSKLQWLNGFRNLSNYRHSAGAILFLVSVACLPLQSDGFIFPPPLSSLLKTGQQPPRLSSSSPSSWTVVLLQAKKRRTRDEDDLNRWYDAVNADATPDNVFWEEMERQRLLAELGSGDSSSTAATTTSTTPTNSISSIGSSSVSTAILPPPPISAKAMERGVEGTLAEYAPFMVNDNWLDEELALIMAEDWEEELDIEEQNRQLEEQMAAMEGDYDKDDDEDKDWMTSNEPWDHWGEKDDENTRNGLQFDATQGSEYLLTDDEDDDGRESAQMEAETLQRLSKIKIKSPRLENARNNPKAQAFFQREPDEVEGLDQMWVSAIDNVCFKNLVGVFRNYGIEFADNFGDWRDGCLEDGLATIEDIASFKARKVFEATGLPCIASRTSFEIEPVPIALTNSVSTNAGPRAVTNANPRVVSGYRFNDIGMHVDYLIEALKPLSEPTRVTRFRTCLCYYDGEMEVFDYGICDVDIYFANSVRTFIPVAAAVNEMCKTLQLTFGLEYQKWLKRRVSEAMEGYGDASVKLRDRVLKEGKVLPNDIIDVSAFMDSMVDVNLMDDCAKELSDRFIDMKPTKILTIATTGLVIALPMAKHLQVPVVYARKERNVVMADTYKAAFSSNTVGKNRELLVSKSHLNENDRILIIDDFLSSGASQEALLRIVSDSGATPVGVGVLLEKVFDAGRLALSGFDIPIHSLCRVASVKAGIIQLVEEEGFDRM